MSQKTFTAVALLCGIFCVAQNVNFESDLTTAFDKAKKEKKIVFIEYYNVNCPVCKTLEPAFNDPDISSFYNQNFVNYKLNTDPIKKEDSLFIAQTKLKIESVPFFLFFDADKNFVHYHSGAKPDRDYIIRIGKSVLDPEQCAGNLSNKYDSGDRSIKTLYAYSNLLQLYKKDSLVNKVADELFEGFSKKNLGSKTSYIITKNSVFTIENGFFDYWIHHIDKLRGFETGNKKDREIEVLQSILLKSITNETSKNWNLEKIRSVKEMIVKTGVSDYPDTFFWQQESLLLVQKDREKEALELFQKMTEIKNEDTAATLHIINYYVEILKNKSSLAPIKSSIDLLAKKNLSIPEKASLYYTELLYHKKNAAKKVLRKRGKEILKFYKDHDINTTELDVLLKN